MELRIFVEPQQGATFEQQLVVAQTAERLGFGAFFRSDHYLRIGEGSPLPGPTDTWVTLGGIARETSTIRLGTLVCPATFRLPGPLAVAVSQVDEMSGGRVELGLGAGWYDTEHVAYGIPFPTTAQRFEMLTEQLEIITGLWQTPVDGEFTFEGAHYGIVGSPALPRPVQDGGPPVILGGFGARKTPALAARFASEFNVAFPPIDVYREQVGRVRAACEQAERDPDDLVYSAALTACCAESEDELGIRAGNIGHSIDELRLTGAAGSPAEVLERIATFAEAGAERIYLQLLDITDLDQLELLGSAVLPLVP